MSTVKKFDFKKEYPDFYNTSKDNVKIIDIPPMKFLMLDEKGNPNMPEFQNAVQALYATAFPLKMGIKKKNAAKDYVIPPLEGLWYMDNMAEWSMDHKEKWHFTLMIRVPDYVTDSQVKDVTLAAKKKKDLPALDKIRLESYTEGLSMQLMHIGPYDNEPPNIQKMHEFAKKQGYQLTGKHHEIYLSDPRKGDPAKMKTILRQPLKK